MFRHSARFLLIAALVLVAASLLIAPVSAGGSLCTIIAVDRPAEAGGEGEGMGDNYHGYFTAGTEIVYEMDYAGPNGGAGFRVWTGFVDPGLTLDLPIYEDGGSTPLSGSYTIPADGNYTIDAGAGGTGEGGMVHVLVQATCSSGEEVDYTCTQIATVSGYPEGGSVPATIQAGTTLTLVAQQADPTCPVEGNIHVGDCGGPLLSQARGTGTAQVTVAIDAAGTYEFCIGGLPPGSEACYESLVTLTAYESCARPPISFAVCPLPVPDTAVMGTFVSDALLHYAPGKLIAPQSSLSAGQSAYVLGIDSTGEYYKIIWVCQHLWVPVDAVGPTYGDVWNGQPLPTNTVS